MIFISAGHNNQGVKDPGAGDGKINEADLTVEFRDLVIKELKKKGLKYISDKDYEKLSDYLKRIQTGSGSVVLEYHFDSAASQTATGATAIVGSDADRLDKAFGLELVNVTAATQGIKNRGLMTEAESHRGRLGLMRESGIVALLELGFISNVNDMKAYNFHKYTLAKQHVDILERYEKLM
jgi:N-acetylmuramoyl-L-alanine amidase